MRESMRLSSPCSAVALRGPPSFTGGGVKRCSRRDGLAGAVIAYSQLDRVKKRNNDVRMAQGPLAYSQREV